MSCNGIFIAIKIIILHTKAFCSCFKRKMDSKIVRTSKQMESPVLVMQGVSDANGQTIMSGLLKDGAFVALQPNGSDNVLFAGVSEGLSVIDRIVGIDYMEVQELLTRAVNNRTRQRNFFQLQNSMLNGEITEDEFYKRIEENADDYVVEEMEHPTQKRLFNALYLSQSIKDVHNSEDLSNLFSFDSGTTDEELAKIEANGNI